MYGRLNTARDNAVLVCHALSGSAQVGQWWPEIFAPGGLLNLDHDCVLCINLFGSCYGSTGPGSVDPETGNIYGPDFPLISIRDNVRAQGRLLDSLGIRRLRLVLGGSIGGMQALEWSIVHPDRVERAGIIAVAPLVAMGLALNHLQRRAIQQDSDWAGGHYLPQRPPRRAWRWRGKSPCSVTRRRPCSTSASAAIPTATARIRAVGRPGRRAHGGRYDIAGYLDHQGKRFIDRFDANAYLAILRTMETWDPMHGHASATGGLRPHPRPA